jgi:hypothetical protein
MTDESPAGPRHDPSWYDIRLQGHLASRWKAWFDDMTLTTDRDGTTLLQGPVVDQAALYGLLNKLRDTGLPLISVSRAEPDRHNHPEPLPQTSRRPS